MGLLAPLYFAGALAVALPILFHLIRRTPHSRQAFSSLMFLRQSPPRLTRRSRLTNIVLLILRALALVALAAAFARPFFSRAADLQSAHAGGKRVAILIDASASMRRGDLWPQAIEQAKQAVDELSPGDEASLYFFDERARPAMTAAEWNELEPSRRAPIFKARLAGARPGWGATHMGEAIATAADALAESPKGNRAAEASARQLVLISDMQRGGHVETLQNYQWPKGVRLDVRAVTPKQPTNAGARLVRDAGDEPSRDPAQLRVRIENEPDSTREQFSLAWATAGGPIAGVEPRSVYVPPGKSQVVLLKRPRPELNADRLILAGDDADFDNTLYLAPLRRENVRVVYIGEDSADDIKGLSFYLRTAAGDSPGRKVELISRKPAQVIADADLLGTRAVFASGRLPEASSAALRRYAQAGGDVFYVLAGGAAADAAAALLGAPVDELKIEEASARDYALLGRIDTRHPLFAPFADARFGDFTRIHFWKHRRMKLPAGADSTLRGLAWFDDGDPFLVERTLGKGRILAATSGWNPADSQLALSTKFVPLMGGLLSRRGEAAVDAQYLVNEPIALPTAEVSQNAGPRTMTRPDGKTIELARPAKAFDAADRPGIYRLNESGTATDLAVNVHPDESRTAPIAPDDLERWGAKLGKPEPAAEAAARERRLKSAELENRQKIWRWLILGVLGLLAVETALAGRLARRAASEQAG